MTLVDSNPCLAKLIADIAAGDRTAFSELYSQTSALIYAVIFRISRRADLTADLLQEVYLTFWQKAHSFDPARGTPTAWMATIARNRAIDEARREQALFLEEMADDFEPSAEEFDPLGSRDRCETLAAIMHCLSKLEPERRQLFLLAYYHGTSREALSKRFGIPVGTVKTYLRRTLAQLKESVIA